MKKGREQSKLMRLLVLLAQNLLHQDIVIPLG